MIVTPCLTTALPGSVSSQLPPCSPAMSTITLPGFMDFTMSAVMSFGAGLPGMSAVVMMMSAAFLLIVDLDEFAAQRFHLVGDFGASVVGAHDGTHAGSGADGGEASHAG